MKLYHGTSEAVWNQITAAGAILPRSAHDRDHNWQDCPSHPDAVYLTNCYAPYFALSALESAAMLQDGARIALIEIDATRILSGLTADEDALEQSTRPAGKITKTRMQARTAAARKKLAGLCGTNAWESSLAIMGTCAHIGPVPIGAVSRVALVDIQRHSNWTWEAMQPAISSLNYKFCGDRYKEHTAEAFGFASVLEMAA